MYLVVALWWMMIFNPGPCRSNVRVAQMEVGQLEQMVETYYMTENEVPDDLDQLTEGNQPITEVIPDDPWGNAYIYEIEDADEGTFVVYSAGRDGQPGTEEDVYARE